MRNFGIPRVSSPRLVGGNNQAAGSHIAQNTRAGSNILYLPSRYGHGGSNLAAASQRGPSLSPLARDRIALGFGLIFICAVAGTFGALVVGYALFVA